MEEGVIDPLKMHGLTWFQWYACQLDHEIGVALSKLESLGSKAIAVLILDEPCQFSFCLGTETTIWLERVLLYPISLKRLVTSKSKKSSKKINPSTNKKKTSFTAASFFGNKSKPGTSIKRKTKGSQALQPNPEVAQKLCKPWWHLISFQCKAVCSHSVSQSSCLWWHISSHSLWNMHHLYMNRILSQNQKLKRQNIQAPRWYLWCWQWPSIQMAAHWNWPAHLICSKMMPADEV